MFAFIARQPILTGKKEVFAYELLFRNGVNDCFPESLDDDASPSSKEILKLNLEDISCQKQAFINFDKTTLLNGLPEILDPNNIVVEVDHLGNVDDELVNSCKRAKDQGFKIALDHLDDINQSKLLLPFVDIVKLDVMRHPVAHNGDNISMWKDNGVKLIAEHVDTPASFEQCVDLGFDYFQGYFFSRPQAYNKKPLPSSKLSLTSLISECNKSSFDVSAVNEIIEKDAGLSYMLLRFINNPLVNKRHKITSLKHALTYMGEVEVKKFIALLALANLADDKPLELLHLSLVRAKFCDLLAREKCVGDNPPLGFLTGLFSLLDALLDQRMHDAVSQLPIVEEVKHALCGGQNQLAIYLALAKAFESATWLKVKRASDMLMMEQAHCHSLFNEAIVWGNSVRQTLSSHFPVTKTRRTS
ncbi:EAL domain-containing protein [Aestuariibacter sp. AA17]|uniref:EAL domain-containing protein n=1 Tax=Fluctibacter corallii TaxID=2984329 RepID=A0ABT3A6H7_9ALTE|nr:HDOD domain-containing protein [Aestuariibacter sp. AA17]MCV2884290.1 EAL domain-containing protein [Aestuariibacter sp. AA17]